jgi:hypothetical protein
MLAVDMAGNVVWYYDPSYNAPYWVPLPIKLLPNGHMLVAMGYPDSTFPSVVQEIDLAWNLISQFTAVDVNNWLSAAGYNMTILGIWYDVLPLPNGHLILDVFYQRNCADIPGCVGTSDVWVSGLVDLDANHKPVWVWDALDHLCSATSGPCMDINRHVDSMDWMHTNSVNYSWDDGNLLLSLKGQCWVLKIDYEDGQGSGDILWRLGAQGDFTLTNGGPDDWFYMQHYAHVLSPNSTGVFDLGLFDDGDFRGTFDTPSNPCGVPGGPACYSRVPIYQVDEVNMTATIVWQDNLSPVYTTWAGAIQLLNDNRVAFSVGSPSDDIMGSRYMEVTHDPSPQVVLKMDVLGQCAYRIVYYPSLYPGVQW